MDLGYVLAAVRRNWILVVVLTALGAMGGYAQGALATPAYRSTATVLVLHGGTTVSELADGSSYVQDMMPSYAKVARMSVVLAPVVRELGLRTTPTELAGSVTTSVQPTSFVLEIAVVDPSPRQAAAIANAIAAEMGRSVASLAPRRGDATAAVTIRTLSPAVPALFPVSPNRRLSLAAGLLAGVLVGMIAVAVRESIATGTLLKRQDIELVTDEPVLAGIVNDPRAAQRPLPVATQPGLPRAESYRVVMVNLLALHGPTPGCLVVASPQSGEGRSSTAANLALAMAHAGLSTLLVDADLNNPAIAGLLGLSPDVGLSSILDGSATLTDGVQAWVSPLWSNRRLDVLTTGPGVANSSELLASAEMGRFLRVARSRYDAVVIDTPPLLESTDGALLSSQADHTLVVVASARTKERHLLEALGRLRMAGADIAGIVLNRAPTDVLADYTSSRPVTPRPSAPVEVDLASATSGTGSGTGTGTGTGTATATATATAPATTRPGEGQVPPKDGKQPDGKEPDGKQPDGKLPDRTSPDRTSPDRTSPDRTLLDGKLPDGKLPDGKLPGWKPPGGASKPRMPDPVSVESVRAALAREESRPWQPPPITRPDPARDAAAETRPISLEALEARVEELMREVHSTRERYGEESD